MSKFIPNSFQVPNAFVDEFLDRISGNATKCYLVVARKTTGWQKVSDRISTDQFMKICGIKDVKTAYKALSELADVKLINVFKKQGEINEFSLNFYIEDDELKPVGKIGSSTKNSVEPVGKIGSSTSTKNPHSTKDTIKNTIQNTTPLNPPVGETQGESVAVLDFLNDRLAALSAEVNITLPKFKPVPNTLKAIAARLKESSVEDCQRVVEYLVARWGRDDKMRDYLSPKTIFRPNNFTEYLTKSQAWAANGKPVLVAGKWVNPQQAEIQASTPTVEEVKALYSQLLNRPSLFRSWQFATLKEKALYYATIAVKNKRPLEREVNFVCRDAISDVMAKIDRLAVPKFD